MTGKHPGHAIVRTNLATPPEGQYPLPEGTVTLARLLRALGYATGGFGKWGLGGPGSTGVPENQGFDRFFGYLCQGKAHNFYPEYLWNNDRKVPLKNPKMKLPDKLVQQWTHAAEEYRQILTPENLERFNSEGRYWELGAKPGETGQLPERHNH